MTDDGARPAWDALGFRFTVRGGGPRATAALPHLFAGLPTVEPGPDVVELVLAPRAGEPDPAQAVMSSVNLAAVAASEGRLLVHGAALSRPDGSCVVLCGPSGSGKSTLAAELVARGHGYVTDETVCLDPVSLAITAYRKPLSVKVGAQRLLAHLEPHGARLVPAQPGHGWLVPPSRLGPSSVPPARLRPDLVVLLTYDADAPQHPEVEELAPAETVFRLGRNTSRLAQVEGGPLPTLARLARRAPGVRLRHSGSGAAAAVVEQLWADAA